MKTNQYIDEKITIKAFWGGNGASSYVDMVYTDNFFLNSSEEYNSSLAVASLLMGETTTPVTSGVSGSSTGKDFYKRCHYFDDLLVDKLGFSDVAYNQDWYNDPQTDSIGAAVARKLITPNQGEPFYLIAVGLRGGNYGGEWSNNFKIGNTINHQGFEESANRVYEFINQYIDIILKDNSINKIKFWISGYSRGAAVSSMLGYKLNKVINESNELLAKKTSKDDIFVYTFETPRGLNAFDPNEYKNIHNIINPCDIVTRVAPESLDYSRPGVDHLLPVNDEAKVNEMKKYLKKYNKSFDYNFDDFVFYETEHKGLNALLNLNNCYRSEKNISIIEYEDALLEHMAEVISTRSEYYTKYQKAICDVMGYVFGEVEINSFFNELKEQLPELKKYILSSAINNIFNLVGDVDTGATKTIVDIFCKILKKTIMNCGGTAKRAAEIDMDIHVLAPSFIQFMQLYPNDLVTLINNFNIIPNGHYPDLCLSWVSSLSEDYAFLIE